MDIMLLNVALLFFIFSRCSLYVEVMDGQSFTKQRRVAWLTPFAFECEWSQDTWKLQTENTQWKVQCMVLENNMKITVSVCWCPNKLAIAQPVCIYTLLYFDILFCKKTANVFFIIVLYTSLFAAINTRGWRKVILFWIILFC